MESQTLSILFIISNRTNYVRKCSLYILSQQPKHTKTLSYDAAFCGMYRSNTVCLNDLLGKEKLPMHRRLACQEEQPRIFFFLDMYILNEAISHSHFPNVLEPYWQTLLAQTYQNLIGNLNGTAPGKMAQFVSAACFDCS